MLTTFVWVGGTYIVDFSILEVCPLLATTQVIGNVGHARGFPPTLEGVDETGIECCSPGAEDPGGFGTNII